MNENPIVLVICLLLLGYGLFSARAERSVITGPMVFTFAGLILGLLQIDALRNGIESPWVISVTEITLILVLFNDASGIDVGSLLKERRLPLRLLFIGLPITMILGIVTAKFLFPEEENLRLILMALILSPTDAALGLAVVTSKLVPLKIKQSINVESGLNDGLALPPILVCIALLSVQTHSQDGWNYWGLFTLKQFVFGPLVGGTIGWLAGYLVEKASEKEWMNHTFQMISSLAIALLAYYLAESVEGNGFIAAYFSGLLLGTKNKMVRQRIKEYGEAQSQILILFIFLLLGTILVPFSMPYWDLTIITYALLSLTVIRVLPALLSLLGSSLGRGDRWFIAWFGPRGIASILYLLMVIESIGINGNEKIIATVCLTVLLSVFLHGITALPLSNLYAGKV